MAKVFRAEERFKNILCDLSFDCESQFMLDDAQGTVVYDSELYAVEDEDFEKDIAAAKKYHFTTIPVYKPEGFSCRYIEI